MADQLTLEQFKQHFRLAKRGLRAVAKRASDKPAITTLRQLLARPVVRDPKLDPEQAEQVRFTDRLRAATFAGRIAAVWTAVPNELPRPNRGKKGAFDGFAIAVQQKRQLMGRVPGASDYVFLGANARLCLEFKAPGGQPVMRNRKGRLVEGKTAAGVQGDAQEVFEEWCRIVGADYQLAFTEEEGWAAIVRHGGIVLDEPNPVLAAFAARIAA